MAHKIQVGIISTAGIANKVVPAFQGSSLYQVVAVGSRNESKAKEFAKKHNIPKFYGTYEGVLDDPAVKLVYIPLPTSMHKEWTIKAAKKGKHVLCEKPVAPNANDMREMLQICKENNVQFMDGVMWVHADRTKKVKEYLEKVGGVTGVNTRFTWVMSDGGNIRANKELEPLGALGDLGWYCVRAILFAYNFELPEKLVGVAHYLDPQNSGSQSFTGTMWFSGGRYAVFDCSFGITTRQSVEISGPKGSILVDDFVVPFVCSPHDFGPTPNYTTNVAFQHITFPGKSEKNHCTMPSDSRTADGRRIGKNNFKRKIGCILA